MTDKRKATRLTWKKDVKLIKGSDTFSCQIIEISLKNAVLSLGDTIQLSVNDTIEISICLSNSKDSHTIKARSRVKRVLSDKKIAVEFYSLNYDSYTTLEELIKHNSDGDDTVINDLKNIFSHYTKEF